MAVPRRAYAGAAVKTTIPAGITGTPASFDIALATGWPSGAPFYVVVDPSLSTEEKILVTRSGVTLTVTTRGADDTSSVNHAAGAACWFVVSAADFDEANRLAAALQAQGDIIVADASGNPIRLARGTTGQILEATASTVAWGQVDTAGIADSAVTAAKLAAEVAQATWQPGDIKPTASSVLGTGWLWCDGAPVSRTGATAALFAAIGTAYGVGDGSTTFNVPDLRGRFPLGANDMQGTPPTGNTRVDGTTRGTVAGEKNHVLTGDETATHDHSMQGHTHSGTTATETFAGGSNLSGFDNAAGHVHLFTTGAPSTVFTTGMTNVGVGAAHNTVPPYQGVNYWIKT